MIRTLIGDCRARMADLATGSAQCCVTSPPYWGLRSYLPDEHPDKASELGLEKTPEEYVGNMVAVFREVRRVLRDDGTCWLNLGDSYCSPAPGRTANPHAKSTIDSVNENVRQSRDGARDKSRIAGLKPKDLVGIPWMVAKALQAPYYTGTIRDERDRIWLAAMLDAEGCMFIHKRKAGQHNGQGYYRQNDSYGPGVEISNTSRAVIERIASLVGKGSICTQGPEQNHRRKQTIYRWNLRTTESRDFVRELYPYLVAKQHQARIMCGCPSSGTKADAAHEALKLLHNGGSTTVDFPAPASLYEPGWYLRSEIIWHKPSPMPESVTDRPTKSHEQIFLLTKSERYWYDAEAIAEPVAEATISRNRYDRLRSEHKHYDNGIKHSDEGMASHFGQLRGGDSTRNARSVWTVATAPYSGAHFATFPPKLIEPCVLAGSASRACEHCGAAWVRVLDGKTYYADLTDEQKAQRTRKTNRVGNGHGGAGRGPDNNLGSRISTTLGFAPSCPCPNNTGAARSVVLDPFGGAGTTGLVADRLGRDAILIELNPEYSAMSRDRIIDDAPLFVEIEQ